MSSTVRRLLAGVLLTASVAAAAALTADQRGWYAARLNVPGAYPSPAAPSAMDPIGEALVRWNRLQQSDSLPFADYSGFLLAYPGWPGEAAMRRAAERAIDPATAIPSEVARFFDRFPPLTPTGLVRQAEALAGVGRSDAAFAAARAAWTGGVLSPPDEDRLRARFGTVFTQPDQDRRMDRLLGEGATGAAARQIVSVSPGQRAMFDARLALRTRRADAGDIATTYAAIGNSDAGFVADRARFLRDTSQSVTARSWLAQPRTLAAPPLDPEKYLEVLLQNARGADADTQPSFVLGIAMQADGAFPAGTDVRARSLGERDDYTSLTFLGGMAALKKLNRPRDAMTLFDRYSRAAVSPQTRTRGAYWAGRAALAAGNAGLANQYFAQAAASPDQFYGQLSSERLGQIATTPATTPMPVDPAIRAAFQSSTLVRAIRTLGELGDHVDQSLFLRTLASSVKTDADHVLAAELSRDIGRPDLGVMVARAARNSGVSDFVATGFPEIAVPQIAQSRWVMVHAISRQESQFDRQAMSRVGARGLMQLMPGTARDTAGKLGMPYDLGRLTGDPQYNVTLGSYFFGNLLDSFGGNHVLAVAAYNAGPGNVRKWLAQNGDPRMPGVDVIDWIEAIPFTETRGYVQRVLENAVVYDSLNPARARMPARNRLSAYLGKSTPG
ncbi:lytic transglycosylase domain-containing protein [Sphingomonas solaris]|uniref:Lytic transglycosylase domain-containing protein n=1 Tax=Alterirhizorhabdus solaris TaxID=2529389 RepID=A0A558QU61_9SPHN|nr:lytic transglycosylase domain-containing protein [Sphingomonas solaris]TVV70597.1 lytic transglycosylase domain-containing protein [Sphingomonas solaris]